MMCRVGSVVAPFCVYLAEVWIYLPQVYMFSQINRYYFMFNYPFQLVQSVTFAPNYHLSKFVQKATNLNKLIISFIHHNPCVAHCGNPGIHYRSADVVVA